MDLSDSPLPLYFGKRHDLFGWQYSSLPQDSRPLGIVIVAPHGYEMMSMHWGLRRCAERLNAAGYPVIRFDLLGVGNSLGDERQPDQVAAWLDSIHQAVDFLKQSSGVANIVVLGVRLGATLAAQVAAAREDISGIILYAPCITGRQYVREMRAFAATIKDAPEPAPEDYSENDVVLAGWLLNEQTVGDLNKLDISKMPLAGKSILYLHREGFEQDKRLIQWLHSTGNSVIESQSTDYAKFSQDALYGIEPVNDFACIEKWLMSLKLPTGVVSSSARGSAELNGNGFQERPVKFGNDQSLFGVFCKPDGRDSTSCIIFIGTAANHHIGTHRMTVDMARKLALAGICSFRIDVSGIGDSTVRDGRIPNQVYYLPATEDVSAAIDVVSQFGVKTIALTGICSGSYLAYNTAARDPRVNVLVLVNILRFIWRENDSLQGESNTSVASIGSYVNKGLRLSTWRKLFSGGVNLRFVVPTLASKIYQKIRAKLWAVTARVFFRAEHVNVVSDSCINMLQRGTQIDMIFSSGDAGMDEVALYLGARAQKLAGLPGFSYREISGADHTYTPLKAREVLLQAYIDCIRKYESSRG